VFKGLMHIRIAPSSVSQYKCLSKIVQVFHVTRFWWSVFFNNFPSESQLPVR